MRLGSRRGCALGPASPVPTRTAPRAAGLAVRGEHGGVDVPNATVVGEATLRVAAADRDDDRGVPCRGVALHSQLH